MKTPYFALEDAVVRRTRPIAFLPPLLARITLGTAFIASARYKLSNRKQVGDEFRQLGIPEPERMARFVAATEIACGSLLAAGLLTRAAALPLIPVMAVAILTARRKEFHSFAELTGVFEFSYLILLAYLAVEGGGKVSLDALARHLLELEGERGIRARGPAELQGVA